MSVSRFCKATQNTFHFDAATTWITSPTHGVICNGSLNVSHNLYQLDCKPVPPTVSVATAACDLRSWHLCLGHANHQSVADLYQNDLVDGMDIDTSSDAPVCDACIRGKQTHAHIPKVREGPKLMRTQEAGADSCGPERESCGEIEEQEPIHIRHRQRLFYMRVVCPHPK
jgi:hypothetical protein